VLKIKEKTRKCGNFFFIKDKLDDDFEGYAQTGSGKIFTLILYLISLLVNYRENQF